jgi:hypothetical protein
VVVFAAFVPGRSGGLNASRRIRRGDPAVSGDVDGLGTNGSTVPAAGVGDVLVWIKAPLMFRNELVPAGRLSGEHPEHSGGVKRLGDQPVVVEFAFGGARIEVAPGPDIASW